MKEKKSGISVQMLCTIAMLIALEIVLARFCSISLPTIRIGFGFVPMAMCGMLYGPIWAGVAYGVADCLGAALFSTGVFPGIVVARVVSGVIFGLFLHREEPKFFPTMVLCSLCDQIVCSLGLTTLALSLNAGTPYLAMMVSRLPQAGVTVVMQLVILPTLLQLRKALRKAKLIPNATI